jgi:spore maturation protein CgeB
MGRLRIYCALIVEETSHYWHRHLSGSLRRMGHDVILPRDVGLLESWYSMGAGNWGKAERERLTARLLDDLRREHQKAPIDLLFVYLFPWQFSRAFFTEAKALGIPSLYFFCDNFAHTDVASSYGPLATLCWVPELAAIPQFEASGAAHIYLPMASNPELNFPVTCNEDLPCTFLGTKTPYRRNTLGIARRHGLDLAVLGDGWGTQDPFYTLELSPRVGSDSLSWVRRTNRWIGQKSNAIRTKLKYGFAPARRSREYEALGAEYESTLLAAPDQKPLDAAAANRIFSRAVVTIGINDQFNALSEPSLVIYAKLRNFEATMAGACFLTEVTPELPALFEENREVMFYRSAEELADKAKFLLAHPFARERMRKSCAKRAMEEHDWVHRFARAFHALGFR